MSLTKIFMLELQLIFLVPTQAKFKWEQLEHPPYSRDMSPCDFHVFGFLKKHLKAQHFNSGDEFKVAVKD